MTYREHAPPPALAPWVQCAWQRSGDGGAPVRVVPDGCIDIVCAAPSLLGVDAAALRDARVAIDAVWGDDGRRFAEQLDGCGDRCRVLLSALALRAPAAAPPDPLVRAAVARLRVPELGVAALARELAVSERQLRRRFETAVGYGPKRLARVLRLARALAAAHAGEELGRAGVDAGYADHAHFTHDCRSLAGVAPSALLHA
jgi:AraC-like DNA-binding protein